MLMRRAALPEYYEIKTRGHLDPCWSGWLQACNGATEWQIHLNPNVQADITAYSGGGNVNVNSK
jgi:hypothetical protein